MKLVPVVVKVIEHVRRNYACRDGKSHVITAPAPAKPLEKSSPTPSCRRPWQPASSPITLPPYRLEGVFT